MLKVNDHLDMLSAQYLVNCLEEDHVCHGITTQEPRPKPMKETLFSRHHSTVLPRLGATSRFGYSPLKQQQSTERAPTPNIGRGADTEPKAMMHSLTAMIRTLPYTAGLQA